MVAKVRKYYSNKNPWEGVFPSMTFNLAPPPSFYAAYLALWSRVLWNSCCLFR